MRGLLAFLRRLIATFQRRRWEEDLDAEFKSNLELHTEEGMHGGLSREEARRQAHLQFGNVESAKDQYRDRKGLPVLDTFAQDVGYGLRMLRRSPGFTVVTVVTLAVGIGSTTAIFTYLDHLLHPFIYKDQDILVRVDGYNKKEGRRTRVLYPPDYLDLEKNQRVFEKMGAFRTGRRMTLLSEGSEEILVSELTSDMLPVLGVQPVLGRWFTPDECRGGHDNVALLHYTYWRDRFGSDSDALGKEIQLNDRIYKIIGVMPPGFFNSPRVHVPLVFTDEERSDRARSGQFGIVQSWAKLKPGVSLEQAQTNMTTIAAGLEERYPNTNADRGIEIYRPSDLEREKFGDQAAYFVLPALFVILIVCANVAHLQLTRAADRQKEVGVRAALGAGRRRLIRQFLTENLILAGLGGGLGVLVAYVGLDAILAINPDRSYSRFEYIAVDQNALYFAVGLSSITGLLFGLAPAWIGTKTKLNNILNEGSTRSSLGATGKRLRQALVVSQIALTTVLLVGAGLMMRNLWQVQRIRSGFDGSVVTAYSVAPSVQARAPMFGFENREEMQSKSATFMNQALDKLRALPGVQSVAGAHHISLIGGYEPTMPITPAGGSGNGGGQTTVAHRFVTHDFFQTLSIPVLQGRVFGEEDRVGSERVAIISESLAKSLFPDRSPLGESIVRVRNPRDREPPRPHRIIGVVADVRWSPLPTDPDLPELYLSFAQNPFPIVAFALRTEEGPDRIAGPVRSELQALNQSQPVTGLITLNEALTNKVRSESLFPAVMITFALIAVLLAAVGIYGLTAYSVAQRTQELGIRMALGARRRQIIGMVIRQGFTLSGLGIVLGALGSWGLVHLLRSELTEVQLRKAGLISVDLLTCVAVLLFLTLVSIAANYLPARRATRVDPMTSLRYE